ncbi:hypothetical protein RRG08_057077 [Elysia crispata]|uniref:Uncharacterized protein n=1 Tax=Elysia crispata TaxID=231223 RepID=A0AAE1E0T2_9GAST|nr:hypothetical protein RRG08_057077 [Elysia crispata]
MFTGTHESESDTNAISIHVSCHVLDMRSGALKVQRCEIPKESGSDHDLDILLTGSNAARNDSQRKEQRSGKFTVLDGEEQQS